jgi:hypothetical protein
LPGNRWRTFAVALLVAGVWLALASRVLIHTDLNADEGFYLAASHALHDGLLPYRDYLYTQSRFCRFCRLRWPHFCRHRYSESGCWP